MSQRIITSLNATTRRLRRAPRPLNFLDVGHERRIDADAGHEAASLMDDLFALVDARLIVPVEGPHGVGYAPTQLTGRG